MSEISQKESQQADIMNDEGVSEKLTGLGTLLREEREKKGLSHEQVSQIIRLRRHILEALENEDWDSLPPSVFVKGFIRSYASLLGLDQKNLIDLYEQTVPIDTASPKPISEPKKSKRGLLFTLILVLGAITIIMYLWDRSPSSQRGPIRIKKESPPPQIQESPIIVEAQPPAPKTALKSEEPNVEPKEMDKPEPLPAEEEPAEYPIEEEMFIASTTEPPPAEDFVVLKGIVKARTWIRIHIDDEDPKEYIFQPGSRPQWKAKEGFYILIGNAAGIDFDFNGKKIENLGNLGQVVSLKLPEDFEITISQE